MHFDYLIIGQGIAGTLLSRELLKAGKQVLVVDDGYNLASSRVASGVINPVTGKRLVKTWMIEQLLPFARDTYTSIEQELGITIANPCSILDFYLTSEQKDIFTGKQATEPEYLHSADDSIWKEYFHFHYGIGAINPCLLINLNALLHAWRSYLQQSNALLAERFSLADCEISNTQIAYKHITAGKIIFCDGAGCAENPYFDKLPWSKDKGEAIIASIPGLPRNNIYKQGINIVPWQDDLFWIGATHDWKYTDLNPTPAFRKQVEEHLNYWLKLPYTITDHLAAQRPTNMDRKPFIGLHPQHQSIGIFNGMGTKGCSVAPYFASQFARHLVAQEPLMPEVDVRRFTRILSR